MRLSDYCRSGFFPAADAAGLKAALDDNRRAIDEAKTLNAPCLVQAIGALLGALKGKAAYKDMACARSEVRDGIAASQHRSIAASQHRRSMRVKSVYRWP